MNDLNPRDLSPRNRRGSGRAVAAALAMVLCMNQAGISLLGAGDDDSSPAGDPPWFQGIVASPTSVGRIFDPRAGAGYLLGTAHWTDYTEEPGKRSTGVFVGERILAWNLAEQAPDLPFKLEFSHLRISADGFPHRGHHTQFAWALLVEPEIEGPRPFVVRLRADGRYDVFPLPSLAEEVVDDLRAAASLHVAADPQEAMRGLVAAGRAGGLFTRSMMLARLRLNPAMANSAEVIEHLLQQAASEAEVEAGFAMEVLKNLPKDARGALDVEAIETALLARMAALMDDNDHRNLMQRPMLIPTMDGLITLAEQLPPRAMSRVRGAVAEFNARFLEVAIAKWHAETAGSGNPEVIQARIEHARDFEDLSARLKQWTTHRPEVD